MTTPAYCYRGFADTRDPFFRVTWESLMCRSPSTNTYTRDTIQLAHHAVQRNTNSICTISPCKLCTIQRLLSINLDQERIKHLDSRTNLPHIKSITDPRSALRVPQQTQSIWPQCVKSLCEYDDDTAARLRCFRRWSSRNGLWWLDIQRTGFTYHER